MFNTCLVVYSPLNPAPRDSLFELSLGLCSLLESYLCPLSLSESCVWLVPGFFALGLPQYLILTCFLIQFSSPLPHHSCSYSIVPVTSSSPCLFLFHPWFIFCPSFIFLPLENSFTGLVLLPALPCFWIHVFTCQHIYSPLVPSHI